jgi:flagellar biosynthesis/type III secretory pathway protein FliH
MAVTISVEETIAQHFDSFYKECEFQGIELSEEVKRLLHILEGDTLTEATSEYTSEYHAAWDEGYEGGKYDGYAEGYDEGKYDGYAEGYDEAKAED